ncbi:DUF2937 family protein [Leisingera sp. ANG-M6]|uniref:DUF2937 family protein n=1 Tax=Leisingera sp. ANG-M6 TaxID=1577900 RepID=UPI0005809494|nr:DUF2937 family protein [Leisingera sp. ANG-M6]KIC29325.1 hypothetical protein RA24_06875 [Leisingera sp. ANG-M6]
MLARFITLASGTFGAAASSQFPEFSQQYLQRLGGAVDELRRVAAGFDADAAALGLTRQEALVQLAEGGAMGAQRAETMAGVLSRFQQLQTDLAALQDLTPLQRVLSAARFSDPEVASAAWASFQPAIPVSADGMMFAGGGVLAGILAAGLLLSVLRLPFRALGLAA